MLCKLIHAQHITNLQRIIYCSYTCMNLHQFHTWQHFIIMHGTPKLLLSRCSTPLPHLAVSCMYRLYYRLQIIGWPMNVALAPRARARALNTAVPCLIPPFRNTSTYIQLTATSERLKYANLHIITLLVSGLTIGSSSAVSFTWYNISSQWWLVRGEAACSDSNQ